MSRFSPGIAQRAIALLALVGVLLLGGCAATPDAPVTGALSSVSEDCRDLLLQIEKPATEGSRLMVVADATASAATYSLGSTLDALATQVATDGGTVSVLAVDGAEQPPNWVVHDGRLNVVGLASDTSRFERLVKGAPGCLAETIAAARPAAAGSDILGAMQLAGTALGGSGTLVVATDGVANAGLLDFSVQTYGAAAADIVAGLAKDGQLPAWGGLTVRILGIGQVAGVVLNQQIVDWLKSVYEAICSASGAVQCSVETGVAADGAARSGLPEDGMPPFPEFEPPVVRGDLCVYVIGDGLLFGPNSSVLLPAADQWLRDFVSSLPGAVTINVVGHTTTFGDPDFNKTLSTNRALAVVHRLEELGLDSSTLSAEGRGGTEPRAVPDHDGDRIIEAAASLNRRVELEVAGLTGCG